MAKTRREFTPEFKREAVALLESSGRPQMQIAAELGIQPSMLRHWRAMLNGASPRPRPSGSTGASPPSPVASPSDQGAEIARLQRELDRTRMERDVLKKRMARPVRKVVGEGACVRSAQTYPACRRSGRRQDGEPHAPGLISTSASKSRFFCQASGTPLDRQAIFTVLPQTSWTRAGRSCSGQGQAFAMSQA
jgi:transposase